MNAAGKRRAAFNLCVPRASIRPGANDLRRRRLSFLQEQPARADRLRWAHSTASCRRKSPSRSGQGSFLRDITHDGRPAGRAERRIELAIHIEYMMAGLMELRVAACRDRQHLPPGLAVPLRPEMKSP